MEEMPMSGDKNFDRSTLERALAELGRRAFAAGRTVEIVVYGGSALLLTLNRQINTGDVDAVFEGNRDFIKKLAEEMAEEFWMGRELVKRRSEGLAQRQGRRP